MRGLEWKKNQLKTEEAVQLCLQNKICLVFSESVFVCVDVELYSFKGHKRFEVACYSKEKEETTGSRLPVAIFSLGQ